MKKYNALYYLLFILLVMGAFASMAQNSYGLKIMGGVAFSFGLLFTTQLFYELRRKQKEMYTVAELAGLTFLSVILGLRVFYIHFSFVELLFAASGVLLILVYTVKMIGSYQEWRIKNQILALLITAFHLSLILFIISLVTTALIPNTSLIAGAAAFVLLLAFMIAGFVKKNLMVEGNTITVFAVVRQFKNHSIVIVSLFVLFSLYTAFNRAGIVPGIYSDEFPQAYYKLVNEAASGNEKPVDSKYRHEEFKKMYDEFVERRKVKDQ